VKDLNKYIDKDDIYLFNTGEAQQAYKTFGCHFISDLCAHRFMVWAPNARSVSVVGDFNGWDPQKNPMQKLETGVFFTFIEGLKNGNIYKYNIIGYDGKTKLKADPFAFHAEVRPNTASKVWSIEGYEWNDEDYKKNLAGFDVYHQMSSGANWNNLDWTSIGIAAGTGAISGALGASGVGLLGQVIGNAVLSGSESVIRDVVYGNGNNINWQIKPF
jgi:hypothetical protein